MKAALLLALAAAVSGCALSAEGELPDVEVTRHGVAIPGVPLEARIVDPLISVPVTFDPRDQVSLRHDAFHSVTVRRVVFTMNGAGGDLSFVRVLRMSVTGAQASAAGKPPIDLFHYQHDDSGAAIGPVLDIPVEPPVEILPVWNDPPCIITVDVQGALPEDSWTADVAMHFAAKVGL